MYPGSVAGRVGTTTRESLQVVGVIDTGWVGVGEADTGSVGFIGFAVPGLIGLQADRSSTSKDAAPIAPIIKKRLLDIFLAIGTCNIGINDFYQNSIVQFYIYIKNGKGTSRVIITSLQHPFITCSKASFVVLYF